MKKIFRRIGKNAKEEWKYLYGEVRSIWSNLFSLLGIFGALFFSAFLIAVYCLTLPVCLSRKGGAR